MNANHNRPTNNPSADVALRNMTIGILIGLLSAVCSSLTFPLVAEINTATILAIAGLIVGGVFFFKGFGALPDYYDLKELREFTNPCRK